MAIDKLNLDNICSGKARALFDHAIRELAKNIKDPNTSPKAKRRILLSFDFAPFSDRAGAEITVGCKTTMATVEPQKGTMFLSAAEGELAAYPKDARQDQLFAPPVGPEQ